jgi:hypothetical protein
LVVVLVLEVVVEAVVVAVELLSVCLMPLHQETYP